MIEESAAFIMSFFPSRAVAFEILGFSVHWYGLMYLSAFLLAWFLLPRLQKWRGLRLDTDDWSAILSAAVLGVIVGGRLGYVLFYESAYFTKHPLEIFAVWKGGMASHGGFIGVTIALFWVLKQRRISILPVADVLVVPIALGLALGRLGNFINQELYGTVTTLPWGIAVPGVEGLRHPTQLYAVAKDVLVAAVCYGQLRFVRPPIPGRTTALFLILYSVIRFPLEFLKARESAGTLVFGVLLSEEQLLTIPLFLAGVGIWLWNGRRFYDGVSTCRKF